MKSNITDQKETYYLEFSKNHNSAILPSYTKKTDARSISYFCYNILDLSGNQEYNFLTYLFHYAAKKIQSSRIEYKKLVIEMMSRSHSANEMKIKEIVNKLISALEAKGFCVSAGLDKDFILIDKDPSNMLNLESHSLQKSINNYYNQMTENPQKIYAFYRRQNLPHPQPAKVPTEKMLSQKFTAQDIASENITDYSIIEITFNNQSSILVTKAVLQNIFQIAFNQLRLYLTLDLNNDVFENSRFYLNKIRQLNGRKKLSPNDYNHLLLNTDILDPSLERFMEWLDLVSFIKDEYATDKDRLNLYQCSALLYAYLPSYIDQAKKKQQDNENLLKDIDAIAAYLQNNPVLINETGLKKVFDHKKEKSIGEKYQEAEFYHFLDQFKERHCTQAPEELGNRLPDILEFIWENQSSFIHRSQFIYFLINRSQEIKQRLLSRYLSRWSRDMLNMSQNNKVILNNHAYENFIDSFIENDFPHEYSLLDKSSQIFLARPYIDKKTDIKVSSWFDNRSFLSKAMYIDLPRNAMLQEAEALIGFPWNILWLRKIRSLLTSLFRFQPGNDTTSQTVSVNQGQRENKTHQNKEKAIELKIKLLGDESPEVVLNQLSEEWNPTVGIEARQQTKENVDAQIMSVTKKLQRSNAIALTLEGIDSLAASITKDPIFAPIHRKAAFHKYITIFIFQQFIMPKYKIN